MFDSILKKVKNVANNSYSSMHGSCMFYKPLLAARLAQSVEHETLNVRVVGSSPTLGVNMYEFLFL